MAEERPAKRSPGRPPRAAADTGGTSNAILEVAIELFSQRGYDAVSTGDIAKGAGFSQSMVHYHFGSKDKLWRSAIDLLMRSRGDHFPVERPLHEFDRPIDRLKAMTRRFIRMSAGRPQLSRIIMHENLSNSDRLNWFVKRYLKRGFAEFDEVIEEGIRRGEIKDMPVFAVANTIFSASAFTFCLVPMIKDVYGVNLEETATTAALEDTIIETLFAGLVPNEAQARAGRSE